MACSHQTNGYQPLTMKGLVSLLTCSNSLGKKRNTTQNVLMKCEQNYLEIQQCFGTADSLKLGYEFSPTPGMHAKQQISNTLETEILSFFHLHFSHLEGGAMISIKHCSQE